MSRRLSLFAPLATVFIVASCDQPLAPDLSGLTIEPSVAAALGTDLSGEFDFPNPPLFLDFEFKPNGFLWVKRMIVEVRFSGDLVAQGVIDQRGAWNQEGNGWLGGTFSVEVSELKGKAISGTLNGRYSLPVRKFFVPAGQLFRLRGGGDLKGTTLVFTNDRGPLGGTFPWQGRLVKDSF